MRVMGRQIAGERAGNKVRSNPLLDEELLEKVKRFSTDKKNNSLEFNEFLKMVAVDSQSKPSMARVELYQAFRSGRLAWRG